MGSARNQAVVPHSTGDTQYNVRDAALRGASLAFSKPPVKPKPQTNTYTGGDNGAFLAATKVGTGRNSSTGSPAPVKRTWTGGSSGSVSTLNLSPTQAASKPHSSNSLSIPGHHLDRTPSPSNIAARLAAARHSPLRPIPPAAAAPIMSERDTNARDMLPPSGSVGNMLARLEPGKPPKIAQSSPPSVRSPKPQRTFKLPPEPRDDILSQRTKTRSPPPMKPKPKHQIELPQHFTDGTREYEYFNTPNKEPLKSPPIKQKPIQLTAIRTSTPPPPKPPPQRGSRSRPKSQEISRSASVHRRLSTSLESYGAPESPVSFKSAKEEQDEEEKERSRPSAPPPRRSKTQGTEPIPVINVPQPTAPVLIKPRHQSQAPALLRQPKQISPPRRPASAIGTSSPSVYHNNYQRQSVQQITKHMTGDSLSSAIMGAALAASSRNASPAPRSMSVEPLFPPRKQHHHHHSPFRRSPSPPKQSPPKASKMRTTMRKEPSSSENEDEVEKYKKKGTRIMGIKGRKHPNKHHEGTRKRWRDQITERERKRYEGVWAANRGLHLPSPSPSPNRGPVEDDPSLDVLSFSVQEIWTRSRLPTHVLAEVWDLVDSRGIGRLSRYEFVVGLWLIDQRLKGRKLPVKVSDSVWISARGVGIKIRSLK